MKIIWVLISTCGFLVSASHYPVVRKKLLFYWGLTTAYVLLGYFLGKL